MATDLFAVLDGAAASAAVPFVVVEMAGNPRGKGDPDTRVAYTKGSRKPFVLTYKATEDRVYEDAIGVRAKIAMRGLKLIPAGCPVAIRLFIMVPIPKSWPRRDRDAAVVGIMFPTGRPDHDNYSKSICDALTGIVWEDDSQICRSLIVKEYAECPGIIAEVYLLP